MGSHLSTVCSVQFVVVNRDNVEQGTSVHKFVWDFICFYRGLTVIRFNNISTFRLQIYLALKSHDRQMPTDFAASNLPTVTSTEGEDKGFG